MTNVHSRHIHRGRVGAPVVTMDHAEAEKLRQRQIEQSYEGVFGAVKLVFVALGFLGVFLGIPALYIGSEHGALARWMTPVVILALAGLLGWGMCRNA